MSPSPRATIRLAGSGEKRPMVFAIPLCQHPALPHPKMMRLRARQTEMNRDLQWMEGLAARRATWFWGPYRNAPWIQIFDPPPQPSCTFIPARRLPRVPLTRPVHTEAACDDAFLTRHFYTHGPESVRGLFSCLWCDRPWPARPGADTTIRRPHTQFLPTDT